MHLFHRFGLPHGRMANPEKLFLAAHLRGQTEQKLYGDLNLTKKRCIFSTDVVF